MNAYFGAEGACRPGESVGEGPSCGELCVCMAGERPQAIKCYQTALPGRPALGKKSCPAIEIIFDCRAPEEGRGLESGRFG